jgi:hypothetical protein
LQADLQLVGEGIESDRAERQALDGVLTHSTSECGPARAELK